ncbi:hypothetical protein [Streptomyces colonosanans]|uniref:Uncharacterized protein n=1 Tax=Streptomyces colonosanans TaxID=1428652 RepID=A0A1S2PHS4_9ACTN|nr:hypothetical protein [Streptomyces colonosanans]OIJ93257.1 hypothetical protein BIV24_12075 [Streptomyces colonosanans]
MTTVVSALQASDRGQTRPRPHPGLGGQDVLALSTDQHASRSYRPGRGEKICVVLYGANTAAV